MSFCNLIITAFSSINWDAVSAIATFAAVVVSLYYSRNESRIRDLNEKRAQASLIAGWVGGEIPSKFIDIQDSYTAVTIVNNSKQPIYGFLAVPVVNFREAHRPVAEDFQRSCVRIKLLPPGKHLVFIDRLDQPMGGKIFTLEISFQDSFGKYWIKKANGKLEELNESPYTYYDIIQPFGSTEIIKTS